MSHHSLMCGNTRFVVTNTYDPTTFIRSQTIEGRRANGSIFHVDLRNQRDGKNSAIFGSVSSWLCHRGRHNIFLELLYGCNEFMTPADVGRYYGGDEMAEWMHYIGLDGESLDPGYKMHDPRYRALERRLGVPEKESMLRAD